MGVCESSLDAKKGGPKQEKKREKKEKKEEKVESKDDKFDPEKPLQEEAIFKCLLLGPGESGKSTIFKQLVQLHAHGPTPCSWEFCVKQMRTSHAFPHAGDAFNDMALLGYKTVIYSNAILAMRTLIRQSERLPPEYGCHWTKDREDSIIYVKELKSFTSINEELARHMRMVWGDPGIKKTYTYRARFQLFDEVKWFFEKLDELGRYDYLPNFKDIIRCRAKTTGILETHFELGTNIYRILDVGGQRPERKKWFNCFERVACIIYVAAINEYDQVLYEDGVTNRMHESLDLFEEICNCRWFRKSAIMLFLNKDDIFREKIKTIDMKCCFQDYDGGCNYDNAIEYLKKEFLGRNHYQRKNLYCHVTCATDTSSVKHTFTKVKDVLVRVGIRDLGLLT